MTLSACPAPPSCELHRAGESQLGGAGQALRVIQGAEATYVRIRYHQVHEAVPRRASRGDRVAEEGPRGVVGQEARGALAGPLDATRAQGRGQRAYVRA